MAAACSLVASLSSMHVHLALLIPTTAALISTTPSLKKCASSYEEMVTPYPFHDHVWHRTLAVSRRRKRRRSRSCRRSAPVLCSARVLAQTLGFPPAVDREPRRQWTPPPFTPPSA